MTDYFEFATINNEVFPPTKIVIFYGTAQVLQYCLDNSLDFGIDVKPLIAYFSL